MFVVECKVYKGQCYITTALRRILNFAVGMGSHPDCQNVSLHKYRISQPIRRTVMFSLEILEKNNDECILILVIYWKKTGLLHTKISNHNIIYLS